MIEDLTNDSRKYEAAVAWREAAIADGWVATPQYDTEAMDRVCRLTRDGFACRVMSRIKPCPGYAYEAGVAIWGPDQLAVRAPLVYDWAAIQAGLRTCGSCHRKDVETSRVGFANRCCEECRPKVAQQIETRGWAE